MVCLQSLVSILFASVAFIACGTVVTGGDGVGNPASWTSYCDTRAAACGISADVCKAREACAKGLLRDDIEDGLFGCLATTCDENVCFQQIVKETTPTADGAEFRTAWQSYIGACPNGNDDVEMATWLVADDRIGDYAACAKTSGCDEASACFKQLDAHMAVCQGWF